MRPDIGSEDSSMKMKGDRAEDRANEEREKILHTGSVAELLDGPETTTQLETENTRELT